MAAHWQYDAQVLGTFAQWASAIASSAAVIVALFGNQIRRLIDRPRLELKLSNEPVTFRKEVRNADGTVKERAALWYHATVHNPHKYPPIHNAQVLLKRFYVCRADGEYDLILERPVGMHWRWSRPGDKLRDISRDYECDICSLLEGGKLEITTNEPGLKQKTFDGPIKCRLVLWALGAETESKELTVNVWWDGHWPQDRNELRHHLIVSS